MRQEPQRIADRYEVSPLDGGGMATIWRGYDTVLDRLVAIKQIRSDRHHTTAMRQELAERFRREARVTAKIEHPGVPAVYDAAIDRDLTDDRDIERLYLVMQLVDGVTVADLLAEHGALPVPWAVAIAAQVCTVLSHAHAIPVVHRDLKPSNVMVDGDGNVKVLDFGVAAVLGTDVTRLTEAGQIIGSRDYMSPEQFHGVGVSPRSDLYALGCLLHEMLTGSRVFDGAGDPALQHVHEPPAPVRQLRPEVDAAIDRLVLDLLAKSPEDRPASAQDVFERLAPFLPLPGQLIPGGSDPTAATRVQDPTRPFRQPLAPRPRADLARPPEAAVSEPTHPAAEPAARSELLAELAAAEEEAASLVDEGRFTLAVEVLGTALATARAQLAAYDPQLLALRNTHAAALFLGGDFRQARSVFAELARAYAQVAGPDDERTRDCRKQLAYCDAELGDTEAALVGFQELLDDGRRRGRSERTAEALELRHQIGILLLAGQRLGEAAEILRPLYLDLLEVRESTDPDVQDVHDLLVRIQLAGGAVA